jgi:hypothetical protein
MQKYGHLGASFELASLQRDCLNYVQDLRAGHISWIGRAQWSAQSDSRMWVYLPHTKYTLAHGARLVLDSRGAIALDSSVEVRCTSLTDQ